MTRPKGLVRVASSSAPSALPGAPVPVMVDTFQKHRRGCALRPCTEHAAAG